MKRYPGKRSSVAPRPSMWVCLALLIGALWARGVMGAAPDYEADLAQAERQKLSPDETRSLNRADKVFGDEKFVEAVAEYDVFMKEFPRSAVAPYALLRKGRATQKTGDAAKALKMFTEVMDLYPDKVEYAAPALYYSGQCHWWGLREQDEAIKAWKEVAEDKDYRKHPAAAYALGSLARAMQEQGKTADATKYYLQEALDFPKFREPVIDQLLMIHMMFGLNVDKVREIIRTLNGLEAQPRKELANDEKYFWEAIHKKVRTYRERLYTNRVDQKHVKAYCRYWAGVMEGKVPGDDATQLELIEYHRTAGLNEDDWIARLDKQFAALQKPGDYDRVAKWILLFGGQPQKAEEYYAKLDFGKMTNAAIVNFMLSVLRPLPDLAKRTCANLHFDEMDDQAKASLLRGVMERRPWDDKTSEAAAKDMTPLILARMKDPDRGKMALLNYWATVDYTKAEVMAENGLPLADQLVTNPAYAKEANGLKAILLKGVGRYEEAIQAYQANNDPPKSLFGLADCYMALKQADKAVEQWREIANKFEQRAPEVAMKIAYAYRDAGQADKYEAELRELARKYLPDTGVGQTARAELKALNKPVDK